MVRQYNSGTRSQQTASTRTRILDSAAESFLTTGYAGSTLSQIASAAGVSVQSVYNIVGGKSALLKAVYDRLLAGDDEPVPMAQRPEIARMLAATDPRTALAAYAALSRQLGERVSPLLSMLLAQAAAGDPDLVAFTATTERERGFGAAATARHVHERFGLRAGLDQSAAADILWALTAPELADRLVHRRDWGWDRFEQWLATTMADALTGRPAS